MKIDSRSILCEACNERQIDPAKIVQSNFGKLFLLLSIASGYLVIVNQILGFGVFLAGVFMLSYLMNSEVGVCRKCRKAVPVENIGDPE